MRSKAVILLIFMILAHNAYAQIPKVSEYVTDEFSVNFQPIYPLIAGEDARINIKTPLRAERIEIVFEDGKKIELSKKEGLWTGRFSVKEPKKEGWQPLDVHMHILYKIPSEQPTLFGRFLNFFGIKTGERYETKTLTKRFWYRVFKPPKEKPKADVSSEAQRAKEERKEGEIYIPTVEAIPYMPYPSAEAASPEAQPLLIRGSRLFSFSSKSIEGTKEGFLPGVNREESLRINVSGTVQETEIDANFFSTSVMGTTQVSSREEKVSILLKRGSTEAYFGDFTATLDDLEFVQINRVLSGVRLKGEHSKWGFQALTSSPQGQSKFKRMYGDGTQGPYSLDFSPVVIDSEQVYVDGILQKRGNDYEIDYNAGTVTFKNKTILKTSIIEIRYDYRETIYQHSTSALRFKLRPTERLSMGITYIDDSDSLNNAAQTYNNLTGEARVAPQSHYVIGADGSLFLGDALSLQGEAAYSERKLNLLDPSSTKEAGHALKFETASSLGPFGLLTKFKRVGPKFESVADSASPKQDVLDYAGILSYKPNSLLYSQLKYSDSKYVQESVEYKLINRGLRGKLTPDRLPSLEYVLDELEESNDPVTGTLIRRMTTKNSWQTLHKFGIFTANLKSGLERRVNHSPSYEVTSYKTTSVGLSTSGIEKLSFAGDVELKDTDLPSGEKPVTRTYNLKISALPSREYLLSLALNYIDDSQDGITNTTDLTYKAEPGNIFKTSGKYTITSLIETFSSSEEGVSKHVGSFKFELRPNKALRLRYYFKPNYTVIGRLNRISYFNQVQQNELNWMFHRSAMLGYSYKRGDAYSIDKTNFPNYTRKQSILGSNSYIYSLKAAPLKFLSTEFNYLLEDSIGRTLSSTSEPLVYERDNDQSKEFATTIKTSLSERFAIDSSYSNKLTFQGSGESYNNLTDTLAQTASLKGIFNASEAWTFSLSYTYSLSTNNLATTNKDTYTISPGAGFIYRFADRLRIDGDYVYSKSHAGAETEKTNYSLRAKYDLTDFIHLTLRGEFEHSLAPDYRTSDISGNVEINL